MKKLSLIIAFVGFVSVASFAQESVKTNKSGSAAPIDKTATSKETTETKTEKKAPHVKHQPKKINKEVIRKEPMKVNAAAIKSE